MNDRLNEALAKLDLTDEQKEKIQKAQAEIGEKIRKVRQDLQGDRDAMQQNMRELMQESRQRLAEILTPEQQQKTSRSSCGPGRRIRRAPRQ